MQENDWWMESVITIIIILIIIIDYYLNENWCQPKEKYEKDMHEILFSLEKRLKI